MNKKSPPFFTKIEIEGQPELWLSVYTTLLEHQNEIASFLTPLLVRKDFQVILTGAGSSAFVGEAAQGIFQRNTGCNTKAIATTDIVTHPELIFQYEIPTLLISFARSGNSPESIETIRLADQHCKEIFHLVITCNKNGELLKNFSQEPNRSFTILLPEAANDKSLAMTGSFTSMLLSILLISNIENLKEKLGEVQLIIKQGNLILQNSKPLRTIASRNFERVVFLGSGPMLGIARECHLKLQELTDGQVICKHDSFLGFRHGPRAVTNEKTLLVYLFSQIDFVYNYELDLALSIAKDPRKIVCLSVGRAENSALNPCLNIDLNLETKQELNIVPAGLVGQLLGFYKSLNKKLNPDNPSVSGVISRVVQGVHIYDRQKPV